MLDDTQSIPPDQAPYLIDFALSVSNGVPFYDLAYLEIDILLRRFPADGLRSQDWTAWLEMIEFLPSDVLPKGSPLSETRERVWKLIQPIQDYAHTLIQRRGDQQTESTLTPTATVAPPNAQPAWQTTFTKGGAPSYYRYNQFDQLPWYGGQPVGYYISKVHNTF